ncbi:MAG TPA: DUF998 domain-containing protein [Mycobacterium sp.]|nr:DUF998 domain-containing protein [Mycobacterium sp.]
MARRVTTPWWAVVSAAAAPVVLLASAAIARSVRTKSYDPFSQSLSVLAVGGRSEWIMTAGFAISAGCLIVTAVGLRVLPAPPRIALAFAGCCGLAIAALPDRLGTATAHIAITGVSVILLAIWPVLATSLDASGGWARRARWGVAVSAVFVGLLIWLCYDAWRGVHLGLSERTATTAEMLWPLVVVVSVRRHLRRPQRQHPMAVSPVAQKGPPPSVPD